MTHFKRKYLPALKVSIWYLIIGIIWIYFSDQIINKIIISAKSLLFIQTIKGMLFVSISSFIIFLLVKKEISKVNLVNEQLNDAKRKLNEAQELGKIGSWEFNIKTRTIKGSDEAARIFGYLQGSEHTAEQILKKIHPDDSEMYHEQTKHWINGHGLEPLQYRIIVDNKIKYIKEKTNIEKDAQNNVVRLFGTIQDFTEEVLHEQQLQKSETQFRMLFENMPLAYALHEIIVDKDGQPTDYKFLKVNSKFEEITGLKAEQIIGKNVLQILPNTETVWIERYGKVALTGNPSTFENFSAELNKYFEVSAYSPEKGKFAVTFMDVTNRIKSSQQIQNYQSKLKELIYELFLTEEREKRQIAIDLHDHFSQLLAISKMKISEFELKHKDLRNEPTLVDAKKYLDQALTKARSMTYELSPPILYEIGLVEAIEWYINKVKSEHQLEFKFFKNLEMVQFSEQIQSIIYRIFTELITNIVKHAGANSVLIIIEEVGDIFYLRVSDDGKGFNTAAENTNKNSFGLFSIKERVEQLKGIAHIISVEGKGTIIDISIPIK